MQYQHIPLSNFCLLSELKHMSKGFVAPSLNHDLVLRFIRANSDYSLQVASTFLENESFTSSKATQWTADIVQTLTKRFRELNQPYKFIGTGNAHCFIAHSFLAATCILTEQGSNPGVHMQSGCVWDTKKDGNFNLHFSFHLLWAI